MVKPLPGDPENKYIRRQIDLQVGFVCLFSCPFQSTMLKLLFNPMSQFGAARIMNFQACEFGYILFSCSSVCLYVLCSLALYADIRPQAFFSSGTVSAEVGWEAGKHSSSFLTQSFLGKELLHAKVLDSFGKSCAEVLLRLPSTKATLDFPTLHSLPQFLALPNVETGK